MKRRNKVKVFFILLVGVVFVYAFVMLPQGREAFIQAIGFGSWDDEATRLLVLEDEFAKTNLQLQDEQDNFSQILRAYYMGDEDESTVRAAASVVDKLKERAEEIESQIKEIDPLAK